MNHTDFLRNVPSNCELRGRMLARLGRLDTVRIILLDTNVTLVETERRRVLISISRPMWVCGTSITLKSSVSVAPSPWSPMTNTPRNVVIGIA